MTQKNTISFLFIASLVCIFLGSIFSPLSPWTEAIEDKAYNAMEKSVPKGRKRSTAKKSFINEEHDGWMGRYASTLNEQFATGRFNNEAIIFEQSAFDPQFNIFTYVATPLKANAAWESSQYNIVAGTVALYACAPVGNYGRIADIAEIKVQLKTPEGDKISRYYAPGFCP